MRKRTEKEMQDWKATEERIEEAKKAMIHVFWPNGTEDGAHGIEEDDWWIAARRLLRYIFNLSVGNIGEGDYESSLPELFLEFRKAYLRTLLAGCRLCRWNRNNKYCTFKPGENIPLKYDIYDYCQHFEMEDNDFPGVGVTEMI